MAVVAVCLGCKHMAAAPADRRTAAGQPPAPVGRRMAAVPVPAAGRRTAAASSPAPE